MKNNDNDNMTIVILKELDYTKQVMHNAIAHHSPTDAQLVPEQRSTPPEENGLKRQARAFAVCHEAAQGGRLFLGPASHAIHMFQVIVGICWNKSRLWNTS